MIVDDDLLREGVSGVEERVNQEYGAEERVA